jgi:hypothetical protein
MAGMALVSIGLLRESLRGQSKFGCPGAKSRNNLTDQDQRGDYRGPHPPAGAGAEQFDRSSRVVCSAHNARSTR